MTERLDADTVARARTVQIADEIHRRRIPLRRVGHELVGACPVCGDGGKGARSDRFAVHVDKNAWLCRQCRQGGGIVDLVMHLDGIGFHEAIARLAGGARPASAPEYPPVPLAAAQPCDDEQQKIQKALRLWDEARPIAGTIAEQYLRAPKSQDGRAIDLSSDLLPRDLSPRVLRFHPARARLSLVVRSVRQPDTPAMAG
jgi:DNA primase